MTDTAPAAAVQIVEGGGVVRPLAASRTVAALARAGWLHDPAEVATLRAVAAAARAYRAMLDDPFGGHAIPELDALFAALDALPPADGA